MCRGFGVLKREKVEKMKLLERIRREDCRAYERFLAEKGADKTASIRGFYTEWRRVKDGLCEEGEMVLGGISGNRQS